MADGLGREAGLPHGFLTDVFLCMSFLVAATLQEDDLGGAAGSSQASKPAGAATVGASQGAWWSFAGSQAAAVGVLVGTAVGLTVAGLKLTGH